MGITGRGSATFFKVSIDFLSTERLADVSEHVGDVYGGKKHPRGEKKPFIMVLMFLMVGFCLFFWFLTILLLQILTLIVTGLVNIS